MFANSATVPIYFLPLFTKNYIIVLSTTAIRPKKVAMAKTATRQWYRMSAHDVASDLLTRNSTELNKPHFIPKSAWSFYGYVVTGLGGGRQVCINELRLGDVVALKKGDVVPANMRAVQSRGLTVIEERITGNAQPTKKNTFAMHSLASLANQKNMVFGGSFVVDGAGAGIIVGLAQDSPLPSVKTVKSSLSKRLARAGIIMQHAVADNVFASIDCVIVDDLKQPQEITQLLQHLVLARRIPCIFFVDSVVALAIGHSNPELPIATPQTVTSDILALRGAAVVVGATNQQKAAATRMLRQGGMHILYVHRGEIHSTAAQTAAVSLIIGTQASQQALYTAPLLAQSLKISAFAHALVAQKN